MKIEPELDLTKEEDLKALISSAIISKSASHASELTAQLIKACLPIITHRGLGNFNVDNVRFCKAAGGSLEDSVAVHGLLLPGQIDCGMKRAELKDVKVAVFNGSVETQSTETKGVVLMNNAEDLLGFNKGSEARLEGIFEELKVLGVGLIVSGGKFGDMELHFMAKKGIAGLRVDSKYGLQRVVRLVRCKSVPIFGEKLSKEDLGFCKSVKTKEIGSKKITFLEQDSLDSGLATVLIRGSTENGRDNAEKALDDGVNAIKTASRDATVLPGGGASEMCLADKLRNSFSSSAKTSLISEGIEGFARALEVVPRILAKSCGIDDHKTLSELSALHCQNANTQEKEGESSGKFFGIDVRSGKVSNMKDEKVFDLLATKENALKLATDVVCNVMRVDSIIMAKPAGGPKFKKNTNWDED